MNKLIQGLGEVQVNTPIGCNRHAPATFAIEKLYIYYLWLFLCLSGRFIKRSVAQSIQGALQDISGCRFIDNGIAAFAADIV
jgi:hypothetical protein